MSNEKNIHLAILKAINKRRFLRKRFNEKQAVCVTRRLRHVVSQGEAVKFLMMWGVGTKQETGCWEEYALAQLEGMFREIKKIWPVGAALKIVFADTHARINRIPEAVIEHYYSSLLHLIKRIPAFQSELIRLSALWNKCRRRPEDVACGKSPDSLISREQYEFIKKNATKRYYGADPEEGARRYLKARLADNMILEAEYSDHIFLTYNNPAVMAPFQPELPVLYVWSLRRGRSCSPWFLPNEECP
ncbi:MAG TPA: hypothetical protein ENK96_01845 [Desulfobulbaceae bacterium]|nr:hypothetical protein [Desulfobulbaceae bacterium]